ncbi:hypothetical protein CBER1_06028 [Cercospora berteroae]|uniref:Uncharacterized protein n=1 Tax=Cercospora berteroae TaxID=357750 RepID=A0A2S6C571_9PEZI|nr:hypothetical protein CBER1_06028 [Cercospora berteroae]
MAQPSVAPTPGAEAPPNEDVLRQVATFESPAALEEHVLNPLVQAALHIFPDSRANVKLRACREVLKSSDVRDFLEGEEPYSYADCAFLYTDYIFRAVTAEPGRDADFYRTLYENSIAEIKRLKQQLLQLQESTAEPGKKKQKTANVPIIDLLRNGVVGMTVQDADAVILEVSAAISDRGLRYDTRGAESPSSHTSDDPPIFWRGRDEAGHRYSFDLERDLELSLRRIFDSAREGTDNVAPRCEAYLSKFVRWNPKLFEEIMGDDVEKRPYQPYTAHAYTSTMRILEVEDGLALDLPLLPAKMKRTCDVLLDLLAKRFKLNCGDSHLLKRCSWSILTRSQKRKLRQAGRGTKEWKAAKLPDDVKFCLLEPRPQDIQYNFKDVLKSYFSSDAAPSEELVASTEKKIWLLAVREPRAFPELFE